jgi:hypothetical protein
MRELYFDAIPVKQGDKEVGYRLQVQQAATRSEESIFEEFIKESGFLMQPTTVRHIFNAVVDYVEGAVAKDGVPRSVAGLKFMPVISGTVESPRAKFDPEVCDAHVVIQTKGRGCKKLDLDELDLVNTKLGKRVAITSCVSDGAQHGDSLIKGKELLIMGENVQLVEGDTVTASWIEDGVEKTAEFKLASQSSLWTRMAWNAALDHLELGTKVVITIRSRGGILDGVWQTRERILYVRED